MYAPQAGLLLATVVDPFFVDWKTHHASGRRASVAAHKSLAFRSCSVLSRIVQSSGWVGDRFSHLRPRTHQRDSRCATDLTIKGEHRPNRYKDTRLTVLPQVVTFRHDPLDD